MLSSAKPSSHLADSQSTVTDDPCPTVSATAPAEHCSSMELRSVPLLGAESDCSLPMDHLSQLTVDRRVPGSASPYSHEEDDDEEGASNGRGMATNIYGPSGGTGGILEGPEVNEVNVVFVKYPDDCCPRCGVAAGRWMEALRETAAGQRLWRIRCHAFALVEHKYFETFIIAMILASSLSLVSPLYASISHWLLLFLCLCIFLSHFLLLCLLFCLFTYN